MKIDIERDRMARGQSPRIADLEDLGRRRFVQQPGGGVDQGRNGHPPVPLQNRPSPPREPIRALPGSPPPVTVSQETKKPDPRTLLPILQRLLDPDSQRISDHLDIDDLIALHECDLMEREEKRAIRRVRTTGNTADGLGNSGFHALLKKR